MKKYILSLICLCSLGMVLFAVGGCEPCDRLYEGTVSMTNPDKVKLQTNLVWVNPQPRIRPVGHDQMVVYCRVKNSSGSDMDLRGAIYSEIENLGYRMTSNPDEAQFTIVADLRHFGESSEKEWGATVGGAVVGGVAGGVIGHNVGSGHTAGGAVAGAAVGGLLGDITANRNKMRQIDLVVDLTIGERIAGGVATSQQSHSDTQTQHSSRVSAAGAGVEMGSSSSGSSEAQSIQRQDDFLYHTNRVMASAQRMNLSLDEAGPVLSTKLAKAVANALP